MSQEASTRRTWVAERHDARSQHDIGRCKEMEIVNYRDIKSWDLIGGTHFVLIHVLIRLFIFNHFLVVFLIVIVLIPPQYDYFLQLFPFLCRRRRARFLQSRPFSRH